MPTSNQTVSSTKRHHFNHQKHQNPLACSNMPFLIFWPCTTRHICGDIFILLLRSHALISTPFISTASSLKLYLETSLPVFLAECRLFHSLRVINHLGGCCLVVVLTSLYGMFSWSSALSNALHSVHKVANSLSTLNLTGASALCDS